MFAAEPPELCSQCRQPIELDEDECLVDLCVSCDRARHRRLSSERRRSSCEDASEPVSPDSVMAAVFEGMSVEASSATHRPSAQTPDFRPPNTTFVFGATTPKAARATPFAFGAATPPTHACEPPPVEEAQSQSEGKPRVPPRRFRRPARAAEAAEAEEATEAAAARAVKPEPKQAPNGEQLPPGWEAVERVTKTQGRYFVYKGPRKGDYAQSILEVWLKVAAAARAAAAEERAAAAEERAAAASEAAAEATGAAAEAPATEASDATGTAAQQQREGAASPAAAPPTETAPRETAPSPAICSETNRHAAGEWLDKARKRHEAGDDAAALRFCEKSLRLHEGNEAAEQLAAHLRKFGSGTPAAEAAARVLRLGPKEHAAVLQLSATQAASADAVRAAYRKLALQLHPDKNQARQAEAAFKRLQAAYEALSARASSSGGGGGGTSGNSGGSSHGGFSDDECFCARCGEECEYGDELCEECILDEEAEIAEEEARRRRGASSHGYSSHTYTSRCYDCGRPYSPPASYCGSKPMCRDCRDSFDSYSRGYDSDDDYGRYGYSGYRYGFY